MSSLRGKVAIVTGSTRGIGYAIAYHLVQAGVHVVCNGTSAEGVEHAVEEISKSVASRSREQAELQPVGRVIGVVGRVEQMETGRRLVETALQHFGRVDILINNAGVVADKMSHRLTEADWDHVLAVHAKGTYASTQPFLVALKAAQQPGVIINMTSLAGLQGTVGQLNYAAAKGAVLAMTYTLAEEWEQAGIRVHAIAPAALTDMTRPHVERALAEAAKQGNEALADYWKIGTPDDVAKLVVYLLKHPQESGTVWAVNGDRIGVWSKPVYSPVAFTDL